MVCKICGNGKNNIIYKVRERQINKGEEFSYVYCSKCGTLQLCDKIDNIGDYYASNYYSFQMKNSDKIFLPMMIKKIFIHFISNCSFWMPSILENILRDVMSSLMLIYGTNIKSKSAILDVGGGQWEMVRYIIPLGIPEFKLYRFI